MARRSPPGPVWFRDVEERFTGLELLFDLIFVFCVSQLTGEFRQHPGAGTALVALLVFVAVWWTWTGVTFATDRFPADDGLTRVLVILAAAAAAVMALAIPAVPGAGEVPFALGYAAVRLLLAGFYARARAAGPDGGRLARFYAIGFAIVGALWIASAAVPEAVRPVVWLVAMALDVALPQLAGRTGRLLPVDRAHLADRCAAFVIIVLGEATVETLVLSGERPFSTALVTTTAAAGALTVALWWGFFDQGSWRRRYAALGGDRSGQAAAVIGSYLHFPIVVGIAAEAAGVQIAVERAGEPVGVAAASAVSIGCAIYLLGLNAMTWVLRVPRRESLSRVRWLVITGLAILLVVGTSWRPALYLAVATVLLVAHSVSASVRTRRDDRSGREHAP